ncbi:MAG: helix-turn-helix transcriptional regulator [Woeseia sp.]
MGLSNKIRDFRFKNGEMTQKQLAERVGVSRQTINAIENARRAPTIDVAIRIADVFRISADQLFELTYEGRPARRERATTIAVEHPEAGSEKPVEIERGHEPTAKKSGKEITFADLRKLI